MTHTYQVSGMTCTGCQAKVQHLLAQVAGVNKVIVDLEKGEALVDMQHHISTNLLQAALAPYPKYQLTEQAVHMPAEAGINNEVASSWIITYKPLLLIVFFITGITFVASYHNGQADLFQWMNNFMAGFFFVFSFFKLLNLTDFANSYAMYDIIAKRINAYGLIYPFIELALGMAYLTHFAPLFTNSATIVVMGISSIGVIQSVLNKRKIKCACLGAVFNLPMSTITIIEDLLMVAMAATMLFVTH